MIYRVILASIRLNLKMQIILHARKAVVGVVVTTFIFGLILITKQNHQTRSPSSGLAEFARNSKLKDSGNDYGRLINLQKFKFIKSCRSCDELETKPDIVIIVHSAPKNFAKRQTIRETWGFDDSKSIVMFMLGVVSNSKLEQEITLEASTYDDILQGNFVDTYRNMTYKHAAVLKWFVYNCPDAKFLVKADDDVFVNTPLLYSLLPNLTEMTQEFYDGNLLLCHVNKNLHVIRDESIKWYVTPHEYPGKRFPASCLGYTIMYSANVVLELYKTLQELPYFWIDDVHTTGTARLKANISFSLPNDFFVKRAQGNALLADEIKIKNNPFLFGFYDLGKRDIRKLWNMVKSDR